MGLTSALSQSQKTHRRPSTYRKLLYRHHHHDHTQNCHIKSITTRIYPIIQLIKKYYCPYLQQNLHIAHINGTSTSIRHISNPTLQYRHGISHDPQTCSSLTAEQNSQLGDNTWTHTLFPTSNHTTDMFHMKKRQSNQRTTYMRSTVKCNSWTHHCQWYHLTKHSTIQS